MKFATIAALFAQVAAQATTYTVLNDLPGTKRNEDNGIEGDGSMPFASGPILWCPANIALEVE